jgi:hypothetical protein
MASAKFNFCFVGRDGNFVCQHLNGNYVVLGMKAHGTWKKPPKRLSKKT